MDSKLEQQTKKEFSKISAIKNQLGEWKNHECLYPYKSKHTFYYLNNILKIATGKEPSHVDPDNHLVNSYIPQRDIRKTFGANAYISPELLEEGI